MIALLSLFALADDRVEHIAWAAPFTLDVAHPYRHTAIPREIREGWLVVLKVDPVTQQPRALGVPNLWIGDDLAVRTNWDHEGGCAVVWVPGAHDLAKEPVFFGSTELPERIDAERKAQERVAAEKRGVGPVAVRELGAPIHVSDFRGLHELAKSRRGSCRQGAR